MSAVHGDGDPPALRVDLEPEALPISGRPIQSRWADRTAGLSSEPTDPAEVLAERLAIDLATAWRAGQPALWRRSSMASPGPRSSPSRSPVDL